MKFIKLLKDRLKVNKPATDFHGAAIIDEKGRELPITEEMIRKACDEFENQWLSPQTGEPSTHTAH